MAYPISFPDSIDGITPTFIHRVTFYRPASLWMKCFANDLDEAISIATLAIIENWDKIYNCSESTINKPLRRMRYAASYVAAAFRKAVRLRRQSRVGVGGMSATYLATAPGNRIEEDPFEVYPRPNEREFLRDACYNTLVETGKMYGISKTRVGQRRGKIIERLRTRHHLT